MRRQRPLAHKSQAKREQREALHGPSVKAASQMSARGPTTRRQYVTAGVREGVGQGGEEPQCCHPRAAGGFRGDEALNETELHQSAWVAHGLGGVCGRCVTTSAWQDGDGTSVSSPLLRKSSEKRRCTSHALVKKMMPRPPKLRAEVRMHGCGCRTRTHASCGRLQPAAGADAAPSLRQARTRRQAIDAWRPPR